MEKSTCLDPARLIEPIDLLCSGPRIESAHREVSFPINTSFAYAKHSLSGETLALTVTIGVYWPDGRTSVKMRMTNKENRLLVKNLKRYWRANTQPGKKPKIPDSLGNILTGL